MALSKLDNLTKRLLNKYKHIIGEKYAKSMSLEKMIEHIINYYENIIGCMPGNVYWLNKDGLTLGCNKNVLDMFGLTSLAEFKGLSFEDMGRIGNWSKEAEQSFKKDTLAVITTGKPKLNIEEPPIPHEDGKIIYFLTSRVPLFDHKNNVIGAVGISIDITERKKIEASLLKAKEAAEAASKAKSEFLAVVSHELRIPLTGILGMAQLLEGDNLTLEQHDQLSDIHKAGDYLLSVVTDILDYAKLEADKTELLLAPLDFRKLIEDTATMLASKVKEKGLQLLINYADNAPNLLVSDARALRHILLNLIGNAIKFTEKGYVWVNVDCAEKFKKRAILILSIKDSGIGIPLDKQTIIFDKFSQADASTTRQHGGTGLGLAITKAYVEQMGGMIKVESMFGKGSTFSCTIPFTLSSSAFMKSPWEAYKSSIRILVIDDTLHGEVLCRHIASSLCELTNSENALYVLRAAVQRKEPFDIVIINHQLNDIDALKLAKEIRQQPKLLQPLLLLIMEKRSLSTTNAAKNAGFFACLVGPIHPTELLITLTAAWEKWVDERKKQKMTIFPSKHPPIKIAPGKQQKNINNGESVCVLLVEDDLIVQKVHVGMLEKIGCVIDVAANGQQALNLYTHKKYNLVFMDVGLPDMTGFEVTKKIRQLEAKKSGKHIPIIGLTGYGDEERKNQCVMAGMDAVAIKPIKFDEITKLLQTWVKISN